MDRSDPSPLPPEAGSFLADGAPPVAITFGSMRGMRPGVLRAAVEGLLEAGRRVVTQGDVAEGAASPNLLRLGTVDHRSLFPRVALVVHHGGAGTTHAVAAAGVPSVVVPHVGDQRYWADRLHRLGVAPAPVRLDGITPQRLTEPILAAAADPVLRDTARALATRLAAEDGLATSVQRIERAAAGG